jgi:hypothetical protein
MAFVFLAAALTAAAVVTARIFPALAQGASPAKKGGAVTPAEARAIARKAYIWGYALVDDHRIQYAYFIDKNHPEYKGDWNTIGHTSLHAGRRHDPDDQHRYPLFVQDLQPEIIPRVMTFERENQRDRLPSRKIAP